MVGEPVVEPRHLLIPRYVTVRSRAQRPRKRRHRMRNGFKVYDVDTHVMPIAEVLERYVDPSFRPRLAELTPYRVPAGQTADATERHQYSVHRRLYRRILGEAGLYPTLTRRGWAWRGTQLRPPGGSDDPAHQREHGMGDEGAGVHLIVPSSCTRTLRLGDT